jgi:hypothetical protein
MKQARLCKRLVHKAIGNKMTVIHNLTTIRWRNIINMFPGSELDQIKGVNEKIRNTTTILNLNISAQNTFRKRKYEEAFEIVETKNMNALNKK